jgi:hypothetical protein
MFVVCVLVYLDLENTFSFGHCILGPASGELKEYVQGAGGPTTALYCGPLYVSGLDACLCGGKLN